MSKFRVGDEVKLRSMIGVVDNLSENDVAEVVGICMNGDISVKWISKGIYRSYHPTRLELSPQVKINKLLMKNCSTRMSLEALKGANYEDRYTGETTAYLLGFLSKIISNPNKRFVIRGSSDRYIKRKCEFERLKLLVIMLELDFIRFHNHDLSVEFELYETYANEFDMYCKLRGVYENM